MKKDLSVMYMIKKVLISVKDEMDKRQLSFDEFLKYWDDAIERLEEENKVA